MSYIEPNSEIRFLGKVLLKSNYAHTYYFANVGEQTNYFLNKTIVTRTAQSYVRATGNVIRVEMTMAQAYQVNYLMFKNTSFENKWFYAFIVGDPVYISNNVVEFTFQLDVLQTWYFDYNLKQCFIEREHPQGDSYGSYLEDEGLSTGYVKISEEIHDFSGYQLGCIITTRPIPNMFTGKLVENYQLLQPVVYLQPESFRFFEMYPHKTINSEYSIAGQSNTLYFYPNIPLTKVDALMLRSWHNPYSLFPLSYQMDWHYNSITTEPVTVSSICQSIGLNAYGMESRKEQEIMTFSFDRPAIAYNTLDPSRIAVSIAAWGPLSTQPEPNFSSDDIIAIYQYPLELSDETWMNNATAFFPRVRNLSISGVKEIIPNRNFGSYIPNNKKLYTYPFSYIEITDNNGNTKHLQYELSGIYNQLNGTNAIDYRYICSIKL